jgi:pimeloyl-ACP methyl ester carboxylesterase
MHDVYTPTLSGLGERAHLAGQPINLSTHVQDIVAVILSQDLHDVILCGHSYGGMVITGVAGQVGERIRTLFYLDAAVPENDQSLFDIIGPERTLRMLEDAGETGTMMGSPGAEFFQVNSADIEWVDRMCTPHPIGCFIQKLRYTGKEALVTRRTYVLCERWRSVNHPT